jgi:hypothetical protein
VGSPEEFRREIAWNVAAAFKPNIDRERHDTDTAAFNRGTDSQQ